MMEFLFAKAALFFAAAEPASFPNVQSLTLLILPFLFSVPFLLIVAQFCDLDAILEDFSEPVREGNVEKFLAKVPAFSFEDDFWYRDGNLEFWSKVHEFGMSFVFSHQISDAEGRR